MTTPQPHERPHRILIGIVIGLVAIGCVVGGIVWARHRSVQREAEARRKEQAAGPRVQVAMVKPSPPIIELEVQGEVRPWYQSTLYAKIAGFLTEVKVDKGDHVKKDQLLARIESPETERQVLAAKADAINKRLIAVRYRLLASKDYVSAQDSQTTEASARVAVETEKQLRAIKSYTDLRAPFDGTVTARFADPGALLAAGASSPPLVTVSKYDHLRIYAYVDQRRAALVRVGDQAQIRFPEERQKRRAQVTRIAGEFDPRTRMMLVEMDLPNPSEILPGGFVDVTLSIREPPSLEIPAETLLVDGERTLVVVIDPENKVRFRPVDVMSNDGQHARLVPNGPLRTGERVAIGLGFRVAEGGLVQPVEAAAKH